MNLFANGDGDDEGADVSTDDEQYEEDIIGMSSRAYGPDDTDTDAEYEVRRGIPHISDADQS